MSEPPDTRLPAPEDNVGGAVRQLASRVVAPEAGLVLLGLIVWVAVLQNLSKVEMPVALTLLGVAFVVTIVILLIMSSRTSLFRQPSAGGRQQAIEEAVQQHIGTSPTMEEYEQNLRVRSSRQQQGG
jgi:hypothetical protein